MGGKVNLQVNGVVIEEGILFVFDPLQKRVTTIVNIVMLLNP